jgi:diguanylate cyclase (GGDEF)-like protein
VSLRSHDFSAFPESPYAAALGDGRPAELFEPAMEAEYVRARLWDGRTLIRAANTLGVMLVGLRTFEQVISGTWREVGFFTLLAVLIASLGLAVLAWSPMFTRWYRPLAHFIVPARHAVAAIPIAAAAASGQFELLLFLPLMVVGPFFFLGVHFRVALLSVALMMVSFAIGAMVYHLDPTFTMRASAFLLLSVLACSLSARHFDRWCRRSFLESRLIAELVELDPLTGTKNRRVFDDQLARLWQQAIEDQRPLAVLLIDVDHFKAFNDRYGHQAGDQALRRVAQALKSLVNRPLDVLTRYGGEEFAALLYDVGSPEAQQIAEQMRRAVLELAIEHRASRTCTTVSVSVGVAAIGPEAARKPRGATQLADEALYEAKQRGRNAVVVRDHTQYETMVTGVFSNARFARHS